MTLDKATYYTIDATAPECDPLLAGRYLCDAVGKRTTSMVGASLIYDNLNNRVHPTRGQRDRLQPRFRRASAATSRFRAHAAHARPNTGASAAASSSRSAAEGGFIHGVEKRQAPGIDPVMLTDRFFLGEPQMRGFDIRGVGPRVKRIPVTLDPSGVLVQTGDQSNVVDDALGGSAYYLVECVELEISALGSSGKELGLRPSVFVDAGALWPQPAQSDRPPETLCVDEGAGSISTPAADNSSSDRQRADSHLALLTKSTAATRRRRASRWDLASTGIRPSVRSGSI